VAKRKFIRTKLDIVFAVFVFVSVIIVLIGLFKPSLLGPHYSYKNVPICGYAPEFVDEIIYTDEYKNADTDKRMELFYDYLIDISENGLDEEIQEDYFVLILNEDDIIVDRDNKTIYFFEQCGDDCREALGKDYGVWFRYDFNNEYLIQCDVNEEMYFWIWGNTEYEEASINERMEMFYERLQTLQEGRCIAINNPVMPGTIEIDRVYKTISYKLEGIDDIQQYSFLEERFYPNDYGWRWDNYID